MKLSEKYLEKLQRETKEVVAPSGIKPPVDLYEKSELHLYGEICGLEAQQTLLVQNPYSIPHEKQLDLLSGIVNKLQEIAEKEKL